MKGSPPALVHQGYGDQGHDDHDGPDSDRGVLGVRFRQASGHEQIGGVVEHLQLHSLV